MENSLVIRFPPILLRMDGAGWNSAINRTEEGFTREGRKGNEYHMLQWRYWRAGLPLPQPNAEKGIVALEKLYDLPSASSGKKPSSSWAAPTCTCQRRYCMRSDDHHAAPSHGTIAPTDPSTPSPASATSHRKANYPRLPSSIVELTSSSSHSTKCKPPH